MVVEVGGLGGENVTCGIVLEVLPVKCEEVGDELQTHVHVHYRYNKFQEKQHRTLRKSFSEKMHCFRRALDP